jgi:NAD(P)-dependent dehydrogenase (short-subunit alcohol dehydrogenase family)
MNLGLEGKVAVVTGASKGIGLAVTHALVDEGALVVAGARTAFSVEGVTAVAVDLAAPDGPAQLVQRAIDEHGRVDVLVNNAGRSIRRSVELSYDRFHDFERTMQLNYFGPVRLILRLLPVMRQRRSGQIVNVSSIGVQTNMPRFSAYVASKSALDAFSRCIASEVIDDKIDITTIHMPLVRTPMIAPTKIYDSFPTISPDEAADLICEAIRAKPKQINTRLGTFGEVAYALAPKAVDQILHMAYKVFPESAAAKGQKDPAEKASGEATALAYLMRGVHW